MPKPLMTGVVYKSNNVFDKHLQLSRLKLEEERFNMINEEKEKSRREEQEKKGKVTWDASGLHPDLVSYARKAYDEAVAEAGELKAKAYDEGDKDAETQIGVIKNNFENFIVNLKAKSRQASSLQQSYIKDPSNELWLTNDKGESLISANFKGILSGLDDGSINYKDFSGLDNFDLSVNGVTHDAPPITDFSHLDKNLGENLYKKEYRGNDIYDVRQEGLIDNYKSIRDEKLTRITVGGKTTLNGDEERIVYNNQAKRASFAETQPLNNLDDMNLMLDLNNESPEAVAYQNKFIDYLKEVDDKRVDNLYPKDKFTKRGESDDKKKPVNMLSNDEALSIMNAPSVDSGGFQIKEGSEKFISGPSGSLKLSSLPKSDYYSKAIGVIVSNLEEKESLGGFRKDEVKDKPNKIDDHVVDYKVSGIAVNPSGDVVYNLTVKTENEDKSLWVPAKMINLDSNVIKKHDSVEKYLNTFKPDRFEKASKPTKSKTSKPNMG